MAISLLLTWNIIARRVCRLSFQVSPEPARLCRDRLAVLLVAARQRRRQPSFEITGNQLFRRRARLPDPDFNAVMNQIIQRAPANAAVADNQDLNASFAEPARE